MAWYKIITFVLYKTKLKARRRYSVLEKFLLRFKFGKVLFDNIYLALLVLFFLGSVGTAAAVTHVLQPIEFKGASTLTAWQVFGFVLLLYCCVSGLRISGQAMFPEDMQILARSPLSQRQLSLLVFSEHFTSTTLKGLFVLIIPLGIPLAVATKVYLSPAALLAWILLFFFGLSIGFLLSLFVRSFRFFLLQRGAFWKTLLFQAALTIMIGLCAYGASYSLLEYFADWLRRKPVTPLEIGELDALAAWLKAGMARAGELGQLVVAPLQHPFWPHSLAASAIRQFNLLELGLVAVQALVTSLLVVLLAARFRGYLLIDMGSIPAVDGIDRLICRTLGRLRNNHTAREVLFRKNLLLASRQLEIVQSGGIVSLFGALPFWLVLGVIGGISRFSVGTEFSSIVNTHLVWGIPTIFGLLIFAIYINLRFLLSVDGEGRNIFLLKLANIPMADLYTCQVRLLRLFTMPALLVLMASVVLLGIAAQFTLWHWLMLVLSLAFVACVFPKVTLLGSVVSPRFEAAHFAESGKFLEQKVIHHVGIIILGGAFPMLSLPTALSLHGEISMAFISVTVVLYGSVMLVSHYVIKAMLVKFSKNVRHAEEVL